MYKVLVVDLSPQSYISHECYSDMIMLLIVELLLDVHILKSEIHFPFYLIQKMIQYFSYAKRS